MLPQAVAFIINELWILFINILCLPLNHVVAVATGLLVCDHLEIS